METESRPFSPKVDTWMPLDIGRYLQDTAQLDAQESGAYLHLLMHYWSHGPLPNDFKRIAQIAKLTDAPSIAQALLSMFFFLGEDGCFHQTGADRRRNEWFSKRQKAHDKAVKAARARWSKEKAKQGVKEDAPSIAQAMLNSCPSPLEVLNSNPMGNSLRSFPIPLGDSPAPDAPSTLAAAGGAALLKGEVKEKGENIGKPGNFDRSEDAKAGSDGNRMDAPKNGVAVPLGSRNGHRGSASTGQNAGQGPDGRFLVFREEVFAYWQGQNPGGPGCPWIRSDRKALTDFLRSAPSIEHEGFKNLLMHRASSEVNPVLPPRRWLANLLEYADGPLDRFGKPRGKPRTL